MKAQEAILKIVNIFDEGNRQMKGILDVFRPHSLKSGELTDKVERSIMFRVGVVVREFEKSQEPRETSEPAQISEQSDILRESTKPENRLARLSSSLLQPCAACSVRGLQLF